MRRSLIVHIDVRCHIAVLLQKAAETAIFLVVENLFGNALGGVFRPGHNAAAPLPGQLSRVGQ